MRAEDSNNNNDRGSVGLVVGGRGVIGKGTIVWWGKTVKGGESSDKTWRLNSTY